MQFSSKSDCFSKSTVVFVSSLSLDELPLAGGSVSKALAVVDSSGVTSFGSARVLGSVDVVSFGLCVEVGSLRIEATKTFIPLGIFIYLEAAFL
jgi:hypothetical protein